MHVFIAEGRREGQKNKSLNRALMAWTRKTMNYDGTLYVIINKLYYNMPSIINSNLFTQGWYENCLL